MTGYAAESLLHIETNPPLRGGAQGDRFSGQWNSIFYG